MKLFKILFYVGLGLIGIGIAALVVASVLELKGFKTASEILFGVSSLCGSASLIVLIVRLVVGINSQPHPAVQTAKIKEVKTVDVKPVEKTKEEKLYDQYVELYEKKLITKEELEQKRVELLGKWKRKPLSGFLNCKWSIRKERF